METCVIQYLERFGRVSAFFVQLGLLHVHLGLLHSHLGLLHAYTYKDIRHKRRFIYYRVILWIQTVMFHQGNNHRKQAIGFGFER